jgi:hypothetical protein
MKSNRGQRWLLSHPSSRLWRSEIEALVSGIREHNIQEIGSRRQYVQRLLKDSKDRERARVAFETALKDTVQSWQPETCSLDYNRGLLELIIAFTPLNAFQTIASRLAIWGTLNPRTAEAEHEIYRVDQLSLEALEAYYPAPPAGDDPGFKNYKDLLWRFAERSEHVPHVCRRLIELSLAPVNDARIRRLIVEPQALEEFLSYALGAHEGVLQKYIGQILGHCLSFRDEDSSEHPYPYYDRFKEILANLGYRLKEDETRGFPLWIVSTTDDGDKLELWVPLGALPDYMQAIAPETRRAVKALPEVQAALQD